MFYGKLADRVRYFKEDAKGVESMCKAIEEMRNQEREEVTREFVVRMIRDGETSVEKMARYSGNQILDPYFVCYYTGGNVYAYRDFY